MYKLLVKPIESKVGFYTLNCCRSVLILKRLDLVGVDFQALSSQDIAKIFCLGYIKLAFLNIGL